MVNEKIDFKKTLKHLYRPKKGVFQIVEVPEMQFLMVDGQGDPNKSQQYADAIEALYPLAYRLKFTSKKSLGMDYVVPPLEGLWWAQDMGVFVSGDRDAWQWRMMIMTPDWITDELYFQARESLAQKDPPASLDKVHLKRFCEGLSVQILHIGSYADEAPTIAELHTAFLPANGLVENGHHHEIYLGDPRRTPAEKLKTVIRQPVRPA
jgi:hypothetical protein